MNKMIITGFAVATAFAAAAMPTKQELSQAQKPVEAATKADLAAFKAGQKTAKEVAESHLALAKEAKNQAEKYLYYQGAFKLYARSGEYSQAIDTLQTLKRDVKDITPEVINELMGQELRGVVRDKAEMTVASHGKKKAGPDSIGKETVGAYTWSYRVKNGEATIVPEKNDKDSKINSICVSPRPVGHIAIPTTLGGVRVTRIGGGAFMWCGELTEVTIPSGVTDIEGGAFAWCGKLTSVVIPSSVTTIGEDAFYCSTLTSVVIPSGVKKIKDGAFSKCHKMTSIEVDGDNEFYKSVNGLLLTKDGTTLIRGVSGDVTIPSGVEKIAKRAFFHCEGLKSVVIPPSVKHVGQDAFWGCAELTMVTMLCERLEDSGNNVFVNCKKLSSIHVPANAKSWAGMKEWQGIPLVFDAK